MRSLFTIFCVLAVACTASAQTLQGVSYSASYLGDALFNIGAPPYNENCGGVVVTETWTIKTDLDTTLNAVTMTSYDWNHADFGDPPDCECNMSVDGYDVDMSYTADFFWKYWTIVITYTMQLSLDSECVGEHWEQAGMFEVKHDWEWFSPGTGTTHDQVTAGKQDWVSSS